MQVLFFDLDSYIILLNDIMYYSTKCIINIYMQIKAYILENIDNG